MATAAPAIKVTEAEWQSRVIDWAMLNRWRVHHSRPAQNRRGEWSTPIAGHPGFPDLVLARSVPRFGRGRVIFAELKVGKGKPSDDQMLWMAHLVGGAVEYYLWLLEDWPTVEATLR